jgi:acyl-coenzyme A synthetase/AMP-(fatty) acid ligase/acyl carrier protein
VTVTLPGAHTSLWTEFMSAVAGHAPEPAVIAPGEPPVTYRELAERARDTSARWLARSGGSPAGHVVADSSQRGTGQIVNFLAAQHAGACYCALDTQRPEAFLRRAVELLSPRLLVHGDDVTVSPSPGTLPQDSANILFTSGTTGTPRAILQTGGQLRWFTGNTGLAPLKPGERVAHCSSAGFDTYLFEVVRTLLCGGCVTVLPRFGDVFRDGVEATLTRTGVTVMLAPATLVNSAARMSPGAFSPLRILYSGGSELYADSVSAIFKAGYTSSFVNLYGPAEGVVASTGYEINPEEHASDYGGAVVIPLGRPLPGIAAALADEETGLPTSSSTGQLVISGEGISAGYLSRGADGTLACTPFGDDGRTFVTGDVVTRSADGCLSFVRRTGGVLKVNGVRTSKPELEGNARAAGAVAAAVAEKAGEPILFVQLPPEMDTPKFISTMRGLGLASAVPQVRAVAEIPVNLNGKHDAAPLLDTGPAAGDNRVRQATAPAIDSPMRARLAEQVKSIHGHPVPDGADLYDLGFSSLQLAMLLLAVAEREGVELTAEELLATPDLDDLARLLEEKATGDH